MNQVLAFFSTGVTVLLSLIIFQPNYGGRYTCNSMEWERSSNLSLSSRAVPLPAAPAAPAALEVSKAVQTDGEREVQTEPW